MQTILGDYSQPYPFLNNNHDGDMIAVLHSSITGIYEHLPYTVLATVLSNRGTTRALLPFEARLFFFEGAVLCIVTPLLPL